MNLIIQGTHPIAATHLDHLGKLSQSKQRVQIAEYAYRLTEALLHPGISFVRVWFGTTPHYD